LNVIHLLNFFIIRNFIQVIKNFIIVSVVIIVRIKVIWISRALLAFI